MLRVNRQKYGIHYFTEQRIQNVLPYCKGSLLDIGCGTNELVKRYGNGIGVDIVDWGGGATIVTDTSQLPYPAGTFDTVTFLASLNHIPNRKEVLKEAARLIKPDGALIVTMINPLLGIIAHKFFFWVGEEKVRGRQEGEKDGMWTKEIFSLAREAGFRLKTHKKFLFLMNNLYIFVPNKKGVAHGR